jgi:hypothetical protein
VAATHYKPSGKTNPQTSKVTPAAMSDFLLGPVQRTSDISAHDVEH